MSRLDGAVLAVREAVATAAGIDLAQVGPDDDMIDDLNLDELERLGLIVEEVFAVQVAAELWASPLYRTPSALAEWLIRKSDQASWATSRQRRHG